MIYLAFAQSRTHLLDLGEAESPDAALSLARHKLAHLDGRARRLLGDDLICIGCRRQGVPAPDVGIGADLARAFVGLAPDEEWARQRFRRELAKARRSL